MGKQEFNPMDYKEVKPKVKILIGKDSTEVDEKAALFEKTHNVIEVKQSCPNVMILFYYDLDAQEEIYE